MKTGRHISLVFVGTFIFGGQQDSDTVTNPHLLQENKDFPFCF